MTYEKNYDGMSPLDKHNAAIQDIKEFLGDDKFWLITEEFRAMNLEPERFYAFASFAGVKGYPAKAWFNFCYPL